MRHVSGRRLAVIVLAILFVTAAHLITAKAQAPAQLDPRLSRALALVRQAEIAGATQSELSDLVALLNKALELEGSINSTPPSDQQKQTALRTQLDQTLTELESRAGQLQVQATQRTQMNHILAYVSGGIVAIIATILYAYGIAFYRKYRIKRTFQMRVSPK